MDKRIARAMAVAVAATMPLLTGCGTGSAVSDSAAPASSAAASSAAVSSAAATPGAEPAAATPSPSADPAQREVQAATETFVKTVLTIGYPDKTFEDYTARIQPLMTEDGFASLESADSIKKGSAALTSLYAQRARSTPTFSTEPTVTSLDSSRATAQLDYENLAQRKSGDDWTTLKSLGTGSVTVQLVLDHGTWLVDNAS